MKAWFVDEGKRDVLFAAVSAVALALSLSGVLRSALPFDIAWVAIVLCGIPMVVGAVTALVREHDVKADMLVSLALIASVAIGEYFAAGEVALIMAIGSLLEDATARRARRGIARLVDLTPKTARVRRDGVESVVPAEQVRMDDTLIVLAGETIAADGVITSGATSVDQSVMTGESIPVDKAAGDEVTSGTLNQFGTFDMRATRVGADSSLQRMIRLAEEADANRAPIVRLADRWATWLVFVALGVAGLTWLITGEVIRAVTVLVVFCPCAFILAAPTAVIAAIGNATRYGILVRSGDALQRFARIQQIAFDKTGTLTHGRPEVVGVESLDEALTADDVLRLTALAEQRSEHPLGKAILRHFRRQGGVAGEVQGFELVPGKGVRATVEGRAVLAGRRDWALPNDSQSVADAAPEASYLQRGATVIHVSVDGRAAGFVALADVLRDTARGLVSELKALGIQPILLTGDNEAAARSIAAQVGIEQVRPNMLPEDKMRVMQELTAKGVHVCMVGDGINDAMALKASYAGIAMGGIGSDIAVEAADAVLVSDSIERIPHLFRVAGKAMRRINFNIIVAMTWNVVAVALSTMGALSPVTAALAHNVGSVFVVVSSAFLLGTRETRQGGR